MNKKFLFTNILGSFVFNQKFMVLYQASSEQAIKKRFKLLYKAEGKDLENILAYFNKPEFFREFHKQNLKLTKSAVKESVKDDLLIIQAMNTIDNLDKSSNLLVKRLREWYGLYLPEFTVKVDNNERFVELILAKTKAQLLNELGLEKKDSMGADIGKADLEQILELAKKINSLYKLKKMHEQYLTDIMKKICPNLLALAGALIGAKLIGHAGSLKHLSELPGSTIQLLGAEKALFRHIRNKSIAPPKYGVIFNHPLIQSMKRQHAGKAARALADKIAIAVKVDYFKGKPIGDKLKKGLETKLAQFTKQTV